VNATIPKAAAMSKCHSHQDACQLREKATVIAASPSRIQAAMTPASTWDGRR
jgi:hypothetical protein